LRAGVLRLVLVAGVRAEVESAFAEAVSDCGLSDLVGDAIEIIFDPDVMQYFAKFNATLARTDVLWTKPSEVTFFAGLGLPLLLAPPIGVHEEYNQRWAVEQGAGLVERDPRFSGEHLTEWLADGT